MCTKKEELSIMPTNLDSCIKGGIPLHSSSVYRPNKVYMLYNRFMKRCAGIIRVQDHYCTRLFDRGIIGQIWAKTQKTMFRDVKRASVFPK